MQFIPNIIVFAMTALIENADIGHWAINLPAGEIESKRMYETAGTILLFFIFSPLLIIKIKK